MTCCEMSLSLPGHSRDTTLKITYTIPDGVQGKDHPNPGSAFQGGTFHAFLPLNEMTLQLSPSLKQAFDQGLTFCVRAEDAGDKVAWGHIPHKTSIEGGKSRYGYPDSGYLKCLKDSLKHLNVKEGYKKENK
ncbi:E3 ubiquitin-protein ligase DTX3L-like [Aplochiton taeniatus]